MGSIIALPVSTIIYYHVKATDYPFAGHHDVSGLLYIFNATFVIVVHYRLLFVAG